MTAVHPVVAAEIADEVADEVAAAVLCCPAVAALHAGPFGQTTTFLPGRRVAGVTWSPDGLVVGVVAAYPATVREIDAQIRAAVALVAPGTTVTVRVEDIEFLPPLPPEKERLP